MHTRRFKWSKTQRDIDGAIRFVVRSAATRIPAYRELLEMSGVTASSVSGLADLPGLPILDKEWLFRDAESTDRLHVRATPERCVQASTGGYTGLPVKIYMSQGEALFRRLQLLAEWRRLAHLPFLLRIADIGSWIEGTAGHESVRRGPASILRVSSALPIDDQARLLARYSPHVISGFPTTVALIAERWRSAPIRSSIRLVATRGEVLHGSERAAMAKQFACRVADFYNCEEIGNIASECPADPSALHINTDACVVEVVGNDGRPTPPGGEGKILLTSLYNCTMPFIRYYVGDRGVMLVDENGTRCACGSRRPRMAAVHGRDDDYVVLPDGERLSPRVVAMTVKRTSDAKARELNRTRVLSRLQIVQDEPDHVTVRVVHEGDWPIELDEIIPSKLRGLHPALRSTVRAVDAISAEPSGKLKKVIRLIDKPGLRSPKPT